MDTRIVGVVENIRDLTIESADLLINPTSVGMKKDDPCPIPEQLLHSKLQVYDVIYNPSETTLLKKAKNKGARVSNGLGMLFYQGVLAFQHWANIQLEEKIKAKMRESLTR